MATYSPAGFVLYEGIPVLQASSVSFTFDADNKDVNTLLLGRAGHSPGSRKVQVDVTSAVPAAGMEQAWVAIANAQSEVSLAFKMANKTYNCRGDIRNVKMDSNTDKANDVSFTLHGILINEV